MSHEVFDFNSLVETSEKDSKPAKKWYVPPLWAWVIALPCWLFIVVIHVVEGAALLAEARDGFETGHAVGLMFGSFITLAFCLGIALCIGLIAKRNRNAFAGVFVALSFLVAFGQANRLLQSALRQPNKTAVDLDAHRSEIQHRRRERIESGNYSIDTDTLGETAERLRAAAAVSETAEDRVIGEVSAAWVDRGRNASVEYNAASNALGDPWPFDPTWIEDKEDLEDIRQRTTRFRSANEGLRSATLPTLEYFESEFAKRGMSGSAHAVDFYNRTRDDAKFATLRKLRDSDAELCDLADRAAALLDKHWDDWGFDPETGELLLLNDEVLEGWNAIANRVNAIAAEQTRLVREQAGLPPEAEPAVDTIDETPTTQSPTTDYDGD